MQVVLNWRSRALLEGLIIGKIAKTVHGAGDKSKNTPFIAQADTARYLHS